MDIPHDAAAVDVGVVEGGLRDDEREWFERQRRELEARVAASDPNAPIDADALVAQHAVCVVPGRWADFEDWLPPLAENSGSARLSRGDVAVVAVDCDAAGDWLRLLVASFMWGQGKRGYGPTRLSWVLEGKQNRMAPSLDVIRRRLAESVRVLRERGAGEAYDLLRRDGRVPELGPAFFTKFLYFAGKAVDVSGCQPMVLDDVLAGRMRWAWARRRDEPYGVDPARVAWLWKGPYRSTRRYRIYLAFLNRAAVQLSCAGPSWTPDLVELILFSHHPAEELGEAPGANS